MVGLPKASKVPVPSGISVEVSAIFRNVRLGVVATACVDTSMIIKAPKQRAALIALPRVGPAGAPLYPRGWELGAPPS
jgi:hypothetical protein